MLWRRAERGLRLLSDSGGHLRGWQAWIDVGLEEMRKVQGHGLRQLYHLVWEP